MLGAVLVVGTDVFGTSSLNRNLPQNPTTLQPVGCNPIASAEVLGRSILHLTIASLERVGVHAISVIADPGITGQLDLGSSKCDISQIGSRAEVESAIIDKINAHVNSGVRNVLLLGVDAYADFDFADTVELYKDRGTVATRLHDHHGPLNAWIVDGVRAQYSGLSFSGLLSPVHSRRSYRIRGYVNRLRSAQDLRQLVRDAFAGDCAIRPTGTEIKPYVWIDQGASVHRLARLVAPVYIGKYTNIQSGALITRGSNIERGCVVECGTVVEDASVLPDTYLGRWLDVSHAVVDGARFVHLTRNVAFEVADSKLFGAIGVPRARDAFWADPIFVDPIVASPRDNGQIDRGLGVPAQIA